MTRKIISIVVCIASVFTLFIGCNKITKAAYGAAFHGSIILGRPTNTSMTASITSEAECEVYLQWGSKSENYTKKSKVLKCSETEPAVLIMDDLSVNKEYFYRLFFKESGKTEFLCTDEYSSNTPKGTGANFNFVIQSDSHLRNKADLDLYTKSMQAMAALNPDFMFDIGDSFLNDQENDALTQSYEKVADNVRQQLPYFNIVTRNAPLFYTIGNHEGEYKNYFDGTKDNLAAKSTIARTTYIPNPIPNEFYSGNVQKEELFGSPQNYYAYTWGDALFVSIDPYRYSDVTPYLKDGEGNGWDWTLGKEQYDWFRTTLENSKAKFKFVFSHHAIGNFRGGAKIARLYEWGGYDSKGKYLFDEKRQGWGKPIQQIMKDSGVTIFFQGHDHVFAREEVDGVIYQTIPKPAEKIADQQSNYTSYEGGDVLLNSGFLNVSIKEDKVQVDYVRNFFVSSDPKEGNTGVVYSYTVDDRGKVDVVKFCKDNLANYGKNEESLNPTKSKGNKDTTGENKNLKSTSSAEISKGVVSAKSLASIPSGGFTFAIDADPHWDENTDATLLKKTFANIKSASPSFLIDLGDTSMAEKLAKTQTEVVKRYIDAKSFFDLLGDIPLYMVTGNHDGENGINTSANSITTWARAARLQYFPFPSDTQGFSGNVTTANYYSFTKDNTQFILLDPYTYTTEKVGETGNGWAATLGKAQYDWLKTTLANSKAEFKFVFIHNLVGGISKDQRGGTEAAQFFEWGGDSASGVDEFSKMRPGWDMPIHDMLVKYNVSIVFHGHDHFYAKQEKDGIIYQLVPQPGTPGNSVNSAVDYGYISGTFLPAAGYLRVVVVNGKATVEYVKTEENGEISIPNVYTLQP